MNKIKTIVVEKIIKEETYQTTDGRIFDKYREADLHQSILNGEKKICPECLGSKYQTIQIPIFGGYENGGYPTDFKYERRFCEKCDGRGYLELMFA